ncbi:MAG: hypothetical protein WA364_24695 [Candidatus Nitrosopolaris sp.]
MPKEWIMTLRNFGTMPGYVALVVDMEVMYVGIAVRMNDINSDKK